MQQLFEELELKNVFVLTPKIYEDLRGGFFENFNLESFAKLSGVDFKILQENISFSKKNVLRGLHFQKFPHAQSKFVTVLKGSILDVIVDIRINSETFGKTISYKLDDIKKESIFIPKGFAHGFFTLQDDTIISYKVDNFYNISSECSIIWSDKYLSINWPSEKPILSNKDKQAISFEKNIKLNNFTETYSNE